MRENTLSIVLHGCKFLVFVFNSQRCFVFNNSNYRQIHSFPVFREYINLKSYMTRKETRRGEMREQGTRCQYFSKFSKPLTWGGFYRQEKPILLSNADLPCLSNLLLLLNNLEIDMQ